MKIVIAGGTGFVGRILRKKLLAAGHDVIILTRQGRVGESSREIFIPWDGKTLGDWAAHLDGADAVINLAGENIAAGRWTPVRKKEILSSRIDAARVIVDAIARAKEKPSVLIQASAVGFYGHVPSAELSESSGAGTGFLAATCVQWEFEAREARSSGTRVILARLGPVLGEKGGMLSKMLGTFQANLGAPLGSGRQWIPWVHGEDVAEAFLFMLGHGAFSGPVNITAPAPVTMKEFCLTLARVLHRPLWPPVPGFLLRILMGEMASVVLAGQKAIPQKLLKAGYRFRHARLPEALRAILQGDR